MVSIEEEYIRFKQQAGWTQSARRHIYASIDIESADKVLEVGCGEGVILEDLRQNCPGPIWGLDQRVKPLDFTGNLDIDSCLLTCGDALSLPYASNTFYLTGCHFTLLWIQDPLAALQEMQRVTRKGGWVAVFAEPDYGGRIDYPLELARVGQLQSQALRKQGANPEVGRCISALLNECGLQEVQVGVMGGFWKGAPSQKEWEGEWGMIQSDLEGELSWEELEQLLCLDKDAWESGRRILYVPTFYGWGRVV